VRSTPTTDATARRRVSAADGLSLIEMLVALLLLGVILSAAAASLIQFMRTAADNERRVQATALMNSLHEEFQALPWREAVVYEGELQEVLDAGFPGLTSGPPWTFEGEELVTLPGPVEGQRRTEVPAVTLVPTTSDGRDYEVIRFVTWSDRDAGIKRFTTIVQWRLYNRVYQERFFSERAATATEAGDPERPRVVQFQVGPSPMQLVAVSDDEPAQNSGDVSVTVRFSSGVNTAVVRYRSVEVVPGDPLVMVDRDLTLAPYIQDEFGRGVAWRATIPALSRTFTNGTRDFKAIGTLGAEEFSGSTSMVFTDGDLDPTDVQDDEPPVGDPNPPPPDEEGGGDPYPDLGPVAIASTLLEPTTVCLDKDDRFVSDVTVTAFVDGLHPDAYNVSATYSANGNPKSENLQPVVEATFGASGAAFQLVLKAGVDHGFRPKGSNADQTDFVINAVRPGSEFSATASTGTLSVLSSSATGCK
jgi:prepilin-type N-terminal cleavage/methylation domain-containing protein